MDALRIEPSSALTLLHGSILRQEAGRTICTASLDRTACTYACGVCGDLNSFVDLAELRLARLRRG